MATHAPITGAPTRAPFIPAPPTTIARVLSRFDREALAGFIAVAIDLLDVADGDPDVEANGDEMDCTGSAEEDTPLYAFGPGDGYPGDPTDAEDGHDREEVNEDGSDTVLDTLPLYALDQRPGPVNYRDAQRTRTAEVVGLVRSPTGGWRHQS